MNAHAVPMAELLSLDRAKSQLKVMPKRKVRKIIRVVIADEVAIFRDSLEALLHSRPGFRVVGVAANTSSLLEVVSSRKPDVVVLDVAMDSMAGMEALREIGKSASGPQVVVLSAPLGKAHTVRAIKLGARAVLIKDSQGDVLFDAIKKVRQGGFWMTEHSLASLIDSATENPTGQPIFRNKYGLTRREGEIMTAVIDGYSNSEIAGKLRLSEQTVKHHLSRVFDKLGVHNRLEMALFAVRHKVCDDSN